MSDRDAKQLTLRHEIGVRCIRRLRTQIKKLTQILQSNIAKQRARQQSSLRKDLEPITNAKDEATLSGKIGYGLHDRREFRQGARAQVITIRKSTGQDHGIESLQRGVLMPDEFNRLSNHGFDGVITIVFTIRARKNDDTKFHKVISLASGPPARRSWYTAFGGLLEMPLAGPPTLQLTPKGPDIPRLQDSSKLPLPNVPPVRVCVQAEARP